MSWLAEQAVARVFLCRVPWFPTAQHEEASFSDVEILPELTHVLHKLQEIYTLVYSTIGEQQTGQCRQQEVAMAQGERFFDEAEEQSKVKAAIVSKYFWVWANVVKRAAKKQGSNIAYIDLFAGPGRYKDGTKSTPLLVLEQAIEDADLRRMLVTIFNDKDHGQSLDQAIQELPGVDRLTHKPQVLSHEVEEDFARDFERMRLVPTLFFVDPWGYKGLSLRLINSVLKDWGCDCIFFFNYNRINMGLGNELVKSHIDALFGSDKADALRRTLEDMRAPERELAVVEAIAEALQEMGGRYVLPFTFRRPNGSRTSHHLIFVSKHVRGYGIMKGIMAKESSTTEQDVPTFEYNLAMRQQGLLFELARPLDDLSDMLLEEYSGKTKTMVQIFDEHNVGRRYISKNYKDALQTLEAEGRITVDPPSKERRKNTFADSVRVTFP